MSKEDTDVCDVSRYLSQRAFEELLFEIDYGDPREIGLDFYYAMCREGLRRWLPGKAKLAAGECLVAALHHGIAADVVSKPSDYDWNFFLSTPWTPVLELTKYAFREVDDGYYYDVCIVDSVEEMMAAAQHHADVDDFDQFKESGWVPTRETVRRAGEVILPALQTDNGKLLDQVSEILERDQQISANTVRGLIESIDSRDIDLKR